jgi:hypothetical protein
LVRRTVSSLRVVPNDTHRDCTRIFETTSHLESDDLESELEQVSIRVVLVREQGETTLFRVVKYSLDPYEDWTWVRRGRENAHESVGRPEVSRDCTRISKQTSEVSNKVLAEDRHFDSSRDGSFSWDESVDPRRRHRSGDLLLLLLESLLERPSTRETFERFGRGNGEGRNRRDWWTGWVLILIGTDGRGHRTEEGVQVLVVN